jgi:AsmA protein
MKAIKYLAYTAVGLVLLGVLALVAVVVIVDGNFVKSRAERYMLEEKKRTLKIDGTPQLKLFPVLRLSLPKTSLSEPGSQQAFVTLETMDVALKVMPLLTSRELAMEAFAVTGLTANVIRARDGRFNFDDLAGEKKDGSKQKQEPPKFRVAEVKIERARVEFTDQASGQQLTIADLNVKTGSLEDDKPTPMSVAATVSGKKPVVALKVAINGAAKFNIAKEAFAFTKLDARVTGNADDLKALDLQLTGDLAADGRRNEYTVDSLSLLVKGTLERDALSGSLKAPKLRITPSKAEGQEVVGALAVKGPGRNVDAKFRMSAVEGSASALSIPALSLDLDSNIAGDAVKGSISTPVKADLSAPSWELAKIVANLTFTSPKIPQKTVTLPITGSLKADHQKQTGHAQVATKFDESSINAKFDATKLNPLVGSFDVAIDKLNMDRYLPPEKKEAKEAPIDLSALRGKTLAGKLGIGSLTARRVKLDSVKADIKLAGGKLDVAPHSASLYGGSAAGAFSADANGNIFTVKETLTNVSIGALLRDAMRKDALEGRGNISVDIRTAGSSVTALKKALAGAARIEMKDGAVKGINLAENFRNFKSMLGSKSTQSDTRKQTDFSDMSASFKINNGVAHNEDLRAAAPFARLGGAGYIDIGNNSLNYTAQATLVNTSKGQGGAAVGSVAGITVPVKLSGSLDNPDWSIDYTALAGSALGGVGSVVGGAASGAGNIVKQGAGGLGDAVRGLFGR